MTKKTKDRSWYPVSALGLVFTVLYALVPPYIVYAQTTNKFPTTLQTPVIGGMVLVLACMLVALYTNQKPFHKKHKKRT